MNMKKLIYLVVSILVVLTVTYAVSGFRDDNGNSCNTSAQEFKSKDLSNAILLDVRTRPEFDSGHIAGALSIDIYKRDFAEQINRLDKSKTYYVYCKTGIRSAHALRYMKQSGFTHVCNLEGGINQLKKAGVSLVR
jgi:rhodanese-related sulfurtransferase